MKQHSVILFLFIIPILGFCQKRPDVKDVDWNRAIAFSCGISLTSPVLNTFAIILKEEKYYSALKYLDSENEAEQILAVLFINKLVMKKKIKLTRQDEEKIRRIKGSNKKVVACSGCTILQVLTFSSILNDKRNFVQGDFDRWISKRI